MELIEIIDSLNNKWSVIKKGDFGTSYYAQSVHASNGNTDEFPFIMNVHRGPKRDFHEFNFYVQHSKKSDVEAFRKERELKTLGIPILMAHGSFKIKTSNSHFYIRQRFGQRLSDLYMENSRKIPMDILKRTSIQIIDVYEYIHSRNYVLGDLNAQDLRFGLDQNNAHQVYLVNFNSISHPVTRCLKTNKDKMHKGSIEYISRDAHEGFATFGGDLENLAYIMLEWAGAELPWREINLADNVQRSKEHFMANIDTELKSCFPKKLCPETIQNYFQCVTKQNRFEVPSYVTFRNCFSEQCSVTRSTTKSENKENVNQNKTVAQKSFAVSDAIGKDKLSGQRPATRSTTKSENKENVNQNKTVAQKSFAVSDTMGKDKLSGQRTATRSTTKSENKENVNQNKAVAQNSFSIGEVVWCKLKGHSHWPAQIESIENEKFVVVWYNDYRRSTVFKSQLFKFSKHCPIFSKNKSIVLQTAIKEALIEYGNRM